MRIGFFIDRWQPDRGGAEAALDLLARHLDTGGHDVHVFGASAATDPPGTFHAIRAGGLSRGVHERRLGRGMLAAARGLGMDVTLGVRHLERVDALWLHGGSHAVTLEARWRAAHGGAEPTRPLVPRGRHRAFLALEREALEGGARLVLCPSELVQRELAARYPCVPGSRLLTVPNGVDLDRFHPRERERAHGELGRLLQDPSDTPRIVFAARNPRLKGLPELLEALCGLQSEPWILVVAGPRRPGPWKRMARRLGIAADRIHWVTHLDPVLLAAGADLCVLPTWRDTSGLVLLESLAAGTPVVTTGLAGAASVVGEGAGTVIDVPSDTRALRGALARELAENRTLDDRTQATRACVAARGLDAWMGDLEAALLRLARART